MKLFVSTACVCCCFLLNGCEGTAEPDSLLDLNKDGVQDVFYEFEEEGYFELIDSNFDGVVDESSFYDYEENLIVSRLDENNDGYVETKILFLHSIPLIALIDFDSDSIADAILEYQDGNLVSGRRFISSAKDGQTGYEQKVLFQLNYPVEVSDDANATVNLDEFRESLLERVQENFFEEDLFILQVKKS